MPHFHCELTLSVISLVASLTPLLDRKTEILWRQDMSYFGGPPRLCSINQNRVSQYEKVASTWIEGSRFSLTVLLTATFAPFAGVGFGFPPLLVMSFK